MSSSHERQGGSVIWVSAEQFVAGPTHPRKRHLLRPDESGELILFSPIDIERDTEWANNQSAQIEYDIDSLPLDIRDDIEELVYMGVTGIIGQLATAGFTTQAEALQKDCAVAAARRISPDLIHEMAIDYVATIDATLHIKALVAASLLARA